MVVLLHNCKRCTHNGACNMQTEYEKMNNEIDKIFEKSDSTFNYSTSVFIRCNIFDTDYGKGIGL